MEPAGPGAAGRSCSATGCTRSLTGQAKSRKHTIRKERDWERKSDQGPIAAWSSPLFLALGASPLPSPTLSNISFLISSLVTSCRRRATLSPHHRCDNYCPLSLEQRTCQRTPHRSSTSRLCNAFSPAAAPFRPRPSSPLFTFCFVCVVLSCSVLSFVCPDRL